MKVFNRKELAKKVGIAARTVQCYDDEGIIIPEIRNEPGKGRERLYSNRNLIELKVLRKLLTWGVPLIAIKKAIEEMKSISLSFNKRLLLIVQKNIITDTVRKKYPSEPEEALEYSFAFNDTTLNKFFRDIKNWNDEVSRETLILDISQIVTEEKE